MAALPPYDHPFLQQLIAHIQEHLDDEHFGVSELAAKVHLSRSSLLRKVKQHTGASVSVFIRNIRLAAAQALLKNEQLTIAEVAFRVGFSSTSYFTRCFRELYGHPPGEARQQSREVVNPVRQAPASLWQRYRLPLLITCSLLIVSGLILAIRSSSATQPPIDKSIAVLPFQNNSTDSSNSYLINGLREAIMNDLQQVEDLSVLSRTTMEQYPQQAKTIPQLSKELQVSYFIEGSGQKVDDQIVLNIQLIEGASDRSLWSQRFQRQTDSIFQLQTEIALQVVDAIEAIITPAERQRIRKAPTNNPVAYDYFLAGLEKTSEENRESLEAALELFQKAIAADPGFGQAYGYVGICYYYLDIFQVNQQYSQAINTYADKAILIDPELGPGLIAKALYYMQDAQYELAVDYLQKTLDYYPNDAWVHNFLSEIFANYLPDTDQYLIHAIQGIQQAALDQDSATASNTYLHLGNALAQAGFIDEAANYLQQSLRLNPNNVYAQTVDAYLQIAQGAKPQRAQKLLLAALAADPQNLLVLQEVAKIHYFVGDYHQAWSYYEQFLNIQEQLGWDIYPGEDIKIAFVLRQLGQEARAAQFLEDYQTFLKNDGSVYAELGLAALHAYQGHPEQAIQHLAAFSTESNFQYWVVLFLEDDPILSQLSDHPQYASLIRKINQQFWQQQKLRQQKLTTAGLLD